MMGLELRRETNIAAIATALAAGQGGIAVIRISGPDAEEIGKSVKQLKSKLTPP